MFTLHGSIPCMFWVYWEVRLGFFGYSYKVFQMFSGSRNHPETLADPGVRPRQKTDGFRGWTSSENLAAPLCEGGCGAVTGAPSGFEAGVWDRSPMQMLLKPHPMGQRLPKCSLKGVFCNKSWRGHPLSETVLIQTLQYIISTYIRSYYIIRIEVAYLYSV